MSPSQWLSRLVTVGIVLSLSSCGGGATRVGSARLPPSGPFALAPAGVERVLEARGIHFMRTAATRIHSLPAPVSVRAYRSSGGSRFAILVYASGEITSQAFDSLSEAPSGDSLPAFNHLAQGRNVIAILLHRGSDGPRILGAIEDLDRPSS